MIIVLVKVIIIYSLSKCLKELLQVILTVVVSYLITLQNLLINLAKIIIINLEILLDTVLQVIITNLLVKNYTHLTKKFNKRLLLLYLSNKYNNRNNS